MRRQLPNVGVQDDARRVLNAGIWLYQVVEVLMGTVTVEVCSDIQDK